MSDELRAALNGLMTFHGMEEDRSNEICALVWDKARVALARSPSLEVSAKPDGTWLQFNAGTGRLVALRVESLADERAGNMKDTLHEWCEDQQMERFTRCARCGEDIETGCEPDGCRDPYCPMMEGR